MTPVKKPQRPETRLERFALKSTEWVGSINSLVVHTVLFIGAFSLRLFGFALDEVLLILTTIVSLEAIYLSIFIQFTVNRNTQSLEEVEEDIEEIQEDVEGLEKNIDEIQEDVEDLEKNVDEIQEDVEELSEEEESEEQAEQRASATLQKIDTTLQRLMQEIDDLKRK